jgi:hypothetical protein
MLHALHVVASLVGPPVLPEPATPEPIVQRPSTVEPIAAGEPAAAAVQPATADPAGEPIAPDPIAPEPIGPDPIAPEPIGPAIADPFTAPDERPDRTDWVRIEAPRYRGTGLLVGAGGVLFATVLYQLGDLRLCGGCSLGLVEHTFLVAGVGMAAGGGALRGSHDAFRDAALRRTRDAKRFILGGIGLIATGLIFGVANDTMVLRCQMSGVGPYANRDNCHFGASRVIMDVLAVAIGSGAALIAWGVRYRRDARMYERAASRCRRGSSAAAQG